MLRIEPWSLLWAGIAAKPTNTPMPQDTVASEKGEFRGPGDRAKPAQRSRIDLDVAKVTLDFFRPEACLRKTTVSFFQFKAPSPLGAQNIW